MVIFKDSKINYCHCAIQTKMIDECVHLQPITIWAPPYGHHHMGWSQVFFSYFESLNTFILNVEATHYCEHPKVE